jgi:guanidinoacetate N-methyltransferase
MTRRLKRSKDFEITLQVKNDDFIRPPREAQRNWLLNRAITEFADDLMELNDLAKRFVPGSEKVDVRDHSQARLTDQEIMEDWQIPVMKEMAKVATESHGDVLEVGFGRGISAQFIQDNGVKSHTIVECNDFIFQELNKWKSNNPGRDIRPVQGMWQDVVDRMDMFDGIFFHTYPLNEEEHQEYVVKSKTFAEHFFPSAAAHLRRGGIFTYLTNEIDSFSRAHQRLVFKYFTSFSLKVVGPLAIPEQCIDTLWANSMVVIRAVK